MPLANKDSKCQVQGETDVILKSAIESDNPDRKKLVSDGKTEASKIKKVNSVEQFKVVS